MKLPPWLDPRKSFRVRLVLGIGILAIALSQISAYLTRGDFVDQIKTDKGLLLAEVAHQMAGEMDKGIFERLREIQIMASLPLLSDPKVSFEEKQALLEKLQDTYRNYAWIGFTDAEGNILVGTHDLLEGKSVAKRGWFINGSKGPAVGDVHDAFLLAKLLPKPENDFLPLRLLDVSAPIRDKNGNLLGVICGHLSWDWSHQVKNTLLAPLKAHTKTDILIIGSEGQILLGTPELHKLTNKLNLPSVAAARVGKNAFLTETWPDGRVYLTGYTASRGHADFPGLGWTVLVRQPVNEAFAVADLLQRRGIITSLVFALAFGVVLWLMAGRLIEPMRRIAAAAGRIRAGEKEVCIPVVQGGDEVALLSQSLAGMVQTLEAQKMELSDKNQQLQLAAQVFSSNTEGIIIVDTEERILSVNEAFSEITGYSADEVIGQTPRMFSSGRHDNSFYESMWTSLKRHGRWQGEIWNRRKNGETYLEWLIISQVRNPADEATHYIGIFTDITQRKKIEEQVRKLAQAVEQSPESILITDLDGNIEYVNETFERNSGYPRNELIGNNPRVLQSGRTPRATYDALWEEISRGRTWQGEFYNRRKDGTDYVELAVISPILQADGRISHYVAVKEDITERKRNAEELERHRHHLEELVASRTQELEEAREIAEAANVSKSAFLANMSHEIRTPLNAIIGLTHLIKRSGVTPQQEERLGKIDVAGKHLLEIINAILDLSKIEAGKFTLEETGLHIGALIANIASMIGQAAEAKHIKIVFESQAVLPHLLGDPTRLQQALLNYASNAVKFTDTGSITLRTRVESEEDTSVLMRFEVEDTGIGIDRANADKIFRAFEQADNSITRKYGGTGLGLVITRKLAEQMGGSAGVDSTPGVGSTFWFTARLRKDTVTAKAVANMGLEQAYDMLCRDYANRLVLLVEDEPINREVALALLNEVWPQVDVVEDGVDAVERVTGNRYDLILMDMQMPRMDGLEATRRIRQLPNGQTVPILAMTANAFSEDKARCFEAGMNDFIGKPVDPNTLFETMLKCLAHQS